MFNKLIMVLFFICSLAQADSAEDRFEEIKNTVDNVDVLNVMKSGPNSINYNCQHCISEVEYLNALSLEAEEVSLDKVMFSRGIKDNSFTIRRTKDSPDKVTIKFEEKYKVCKKTIVHQNPLSGQIGFSCLISTYEFREDSIEIDFSDRKLEGDSEVIRVDLVKLSRDNKSFINANFKDESGRGISSNRSRKFLFFGTKYNLE